MKPRSRDRKYSLLISGRVDWKHGGTEVTEEIGGRGSVFSVFPNRSPSDRRSIIEEVVR